MSTVTVGWNLCDRMSTPPIESPPASHPARRLALDPYVERIRVWCEEHAREGDSGSFELRAGGRLLKFEPAEFALIHHSALVAAETGQPGDRLAVEAIAMALKSLEDLARLRTAKDGNSSEYHSMHAELMVDGALGTTLLAEIQARTDELVAQGMVEQSRMLSQFNHRVWNTTAEVEKVIVGSELERSEALAASLTDRPLDRPAVVAPAPGVPNPVPATVAAPLEFDATIDLLEQGPADLTARQSRNAPSLTVILFVGLLLATAVWFLLFGPLRSSETAGRELTLDSFDGKLTAIDTRAPSLYGSVDGARWESLGTAARLNLVDEVGRVLSRSGYSGALLRTGDGVPVAQWLERRGSQLLENRELP